MRTLNSVKIVESFFETVWNGKNPNAIDQFVVDDFIITTGGIDIATKERFKEWVTQFLVKISDFNLEILESFQNEDGSRVASRWRITGKNNGVMETPADQRPITFTGTAVWEVNKEGKLLHNWVERSFWELHQYLNEK
ncbi:ester cyclase [Bacillus rugosus]|uniref:ester cyclase n=1 Tax=Bacillus rugosus TaxID=2715209 RepID=UPI002DB9751E|nr:nuclear transport factor 2 family protein [Bacillus rugosus]MEC1549882.1 ester cyclase [Bacillus rugosus]